MKNGMDVRMYEKIVIANDCSSKWNANPVFIPKLGQLQSRLTFHYHFIYEYIPVSHIEVVVNVHNLLNILSHQSLFLIDIKHKY